MLIVGLGNPGDKYRMTRHNIGFLLLDMLAESYEFQSWQAKHKGLLNKGNIEGQDVILLKPQTYMNLSGESVIACCNFFKIPLDEVLVIHDDIDVPFAKVKVKTGGGHGGHNGLRSIDQHCGVNYHRVRFGVGKPIYDTADYVLSNFTGDEVRMLGEVLPLFLEKFPILQKKDFAKFSSWYNQELEKIIP